VRNKKAITALIVAFYALHQDWWLWRDAKPLVFGFLPVGLFYHVSYTVAAAGLMWLLVHTCWPSRLERDEP
jgi:hypothetical protein